MKDTSDMTVMNERRIPLITLTRSWREHRYTRKESSEITDIGNREAAKEAEVFQSHSPNTAHNEQRCDENTDCDRAPQSK